MGGTLVFRASRVPAQTLLDYLDDGYTLGTPRSSSASLGAKPMRIVLDENLPRPLMQI